MAKGNKIVVKYLGCSEWGWKMWGKTQVSASSMTCRFTRVSALRSARAFAARFKVPPDVLIEE
jgi:hypothetical protein